MVSMESILERYERHANPVQLVGADKESQQVAQHKKVFLYSYINIICQLILVLLIIKSLLIK